MSPTEQEPAQRKPNILVVDDDDFIRRFFKATLERHGALVHQAEDGEAAERVLGTQQVDLVVMDHMMPGKDGLQVAHDMKANPAWHDIPVILVSAHVDPLLRAKAMDEGVDDCISKPLRMDNLLIKTQAILRQRAQHLTDLARNAALQAELGVVRAQLMHVEQMATLGRLAQGVGHELGNVATVLLTGTQLARAQVEEGVLPSQDELRALETAATHAAAHANHLLRLGRPASDKGETLDLHQVATDVVKVLRLSGKLRKVDIHVINQGDTLVRLNRTRLEQVILNLMMNALDAVAQTQQASIVVSVGRAGHNAALAVQDNGCGMDEELLAHVFEPYVTTKEPGQGTGLGLHVVKDIVEGCGGQVMLSSRRDEGTLAAITLPDAATALARHTGSAVTTLS